MKKKFRNIIYILSAFLMLVLVVCILKMQESNNINEWKKYSKDTKTVVVQTTTTENDVDNIEIIIQCVDKIATLNGSERMLITDVINLCYLGIQTTNAF